MEDGKLADPRTEISRAGVFPGFPDGRFWGSPKNGKFPLSLSPNPFGGKLPVSRLTFPPPPGGVTPRGYP